MARKNKEDKPQDIDESMAMPPLEPTPDLATLLGEHIDPTDSTQVAIMGYPTEFFANNPLGRFNPAIMTRIGQGNPEHLLIFNTTQVSVEVFTKVTNELHEQGANVVITGWPAHPSVFLKKIL